MIHNFELLDNFILNSKPRINLFWKTIFGGAGEEGLYVALYLLSLQPFIAGFAIIAEKLSKHVPLYFIGFEKFSALLPNIFSIILNTFLWILYFLLAIAILISCYKPFNQKMDLLRKERSEKLLKNFSPPETVVFSSLKVSNELNKYAKSKMPSDFGLGGNLDWIEGCFHKILTGKRPTGSYSGSSIDSNSFFAGLKDENDASERLNLYNWYDKEDVQKDQIILKLLKLKDYVSNIGIWHDYSLGAEVYRSIAQTFLAANLKQKVNFKENLDHTLEIYEQYSKTKSPLKGIPHYTIRFAPKIVITCILIGILILLSAFIIFILPKWIVSFSSKNLHIILDINNVKEMINYFFVLLGLLSFLVVRIWKK